MSSNMEDSQISNVSPLGVGVVYSSGLEPLLYSEPNLIDVLEIEPQTTWMEDPRETGSIQSRGEVEDHIAALPGHKLVHSVGTPVGGSVASREVQLPLLRRALKKFQAPFASEHLAFNLTRDFFTGFFLPPRQTAAGLEVYSNSIVTLRNALGVPLAVETGVNYLRRRSDEIPDGEFVAEIVRATGCGILLDLHNVFCNQLNGRQTIEQFLYQIPLDSVWEIHLAGGFELEGYWLDAHSGAIPPQLFSIAQEVVPLLPNLKAIIFEMFSSFLPAFGINSVKGEIEKLRLLWELRRPAASKERAPRRCNSIPAEPGPTWSSGRNPWDAWLLAGRPLPKMIILWWLTPGSRSFRN